MQRYAEALTYLLCYSLMGKDWCWELISELGTRVSFRVPIFWLRLRLGLGAGENRVWVRVPIFKGTEW